MVRLKETKTRIVNIRYFVLQIQRMQIEYIFVGKGSDFIND